MKKQRLTALLTSIFIAAQTCALQASALQSNTPEMQSARSSTAHLEQGQLHTQALLSGEISEAARNADLPASYDLRKEGLVTSVKDQYSYGTCWAFAAMASLESTMVAEDPNVDLSEWILAYTMYCEEFGFPRTSDTESLFDEGGIYANTAAMLMSGVGSVQEEYQNYWYGNEDIEGCGYTADEWRSARCCQATDCITLPYWQYNDNFEEQKQAVKNAIYEGHALSMSYMHDDAYFNESNNSYCYLYNFDDDEAAGRPKVGESYAHAITVVGWDDNYPAENFINTPDSDGAWLCRNSWGTSWGDYGYFWISYADESVWDIFYLNSGSVSEYQNIEQYDEYGFWNSLMLGDSAYGNESIYAANVFTAKEDCYVTAAMLCTTMTDEDYEIIVYSDLANPDDPSSGTPSAVTSGHLSEIGYHTVDLSEPVFVAAGDSYAVTVKYSGAEGYHLACEGAYRSVTQYDDGSEEVYQGDLFDLINNSRMPGQSFCSLDGNQWEDMYKVGYTNNEEFYELTQDDIDWYLNEMGKYPVSFSYVDVNTNICLKAFTQPADKILFSHPDGQLLPGTEITLSSRIGGEIRYCINGGAEMAYTEPIPFTGEEMTISAYTTAGASGRSEAHYTAKKPELSSLLFIEPIDEWEFSAYLIDDNGIYVYPTEIATETMTLLPIGRGTIWVNGEIVESGDTLTVATGNEDVTDITLRVEEDGVTEEYIVRFKDLRELAYGDVNEDGACDAVDAAEVLVYAAAVGSGETPELPDPYWLDRADINYDGSADSIDAAEMLYIAAMEGSGEAVG